MSISLIVAMDLNRVIGLNKRVPWRLPVDMKFFKATTMGKTVIMGRKTYESIGRPLQGRKNVVLTRQEDYDADGCLVAHSLEEALRLAGDGEVMVIGGSELYREFLPIANRLYVTLLEAEFEGDTYFPEINESEWFEVSRETHLPNEDHAYPFYFVTLKRRE